MRARVASCAPQVVADDTINDVADNRTNSLVFMIGTPLSFFFEFSGLGKFRSLPYVLHLTLGYAKCRMWKSTKSEAPLVTVLRFTFTTFGENQCWKLGSCSLRNHSRGQYLANSIQE